MLKSTKKCLTHSFFQVGALWPFEWPGCNDINPTHAHGSHDCGTALSAFRAHSVYLERRATAHVSVMSSAAVNVNIFLIAHV